MRDQLAGRLVGKAPLLQTAEQHPLGLCRKTDHNGA